MSDRTFSIGDRVQVSANCWNERLRGAVGVVSTKPELSANRMDDLILWIEFDPWIPAADGHPIEAAEVDAADLDPA